MWLGHLGFEGDEQADRKNHGGPDKAALVYPAEHYPYWLERYGFSFADRGLGENLRTGEVDDSDWDETTVHPGDRFRIGQAVVRIAAPRRPCYKLGLAHGIRGLAVDVQATGRTGFYLAVEEPGFIEAGDSVELVDLAGHGVSAFEVNRVFNVDKFDQDGIARVLTAAADLPDRWVAKLLSRQSSGRQSSGQHDPLAAESSPAASSPTASSPTASTGEDDSRLFGSSGLG